jgi:hypothetical protein
LHVVDEKGRGLEQVPLATLQLFEFRGGDMVPMPPERVAEKLPSLARGQPAQSVR